jgi:hypothetical protein
VGRRDGRTEPRIKVRTSTTKERGARIVVVTHRSKAKHEPELFARPWRRRPVDLLEVDLEKTCGITAEPERQAPLRLSSCLASAPSGYWSSEQAGSCSIGASNDRAEEWGAAVRPSARTWTDEEFHAVVEMAHIINSMTRTMVPASC